MYIVVFYSYLLKLTEWLMLAISGIESTTCFKNMPMQRTIPENITAAKAIVKIVIIIINLFKIYYLLFLKCECKVNTFLSNNGIFCREISLQYVFLDMGQPSQAISVRENSLPSLSTKTGFAQSAWSYDRPSPPFVTTK